MTFTNRGPTDDRLQTCPACNGTGRLKVTLPLPMTVICTTCEGRGLIEIEKPSKRPLWQRLFIWLQRIFRFFRRKRAEQDQQREKDR